VLAHDAPDCTKVTAMLRAVQPIGSGYGGGLRAAAPTPTAVGGNGFASPGTAAATPLGVADSTVSEARNNRGTNVQIPYARVVPVGGYVSQRGRQHEVKVNGVPQAEYEGLHTGELAWIKSGRREGGTSTFRYGHDTNRMQRLASTPWVEGYFEAHMSDKMIPLHTLDVKPGDTSTNSLLHTYSGSVDDTRKSVLNLTDVVSARNGKLLSGDGKAYDVQATRAASGISTFETGPFLRGLQEQSDLAELSDRKKEPRNLSDMLAISALEDALDKQGLMDWTPDGIIASKYEAPAGDYAASAELDASSGQLFNLAVQGPAISKTWTSSLGQHRQKCHPLDKVFICMVADLTWRDADGMRSDDDVTAYTSDVKKIIELKRLADKQPLSETQKTALNDAQARMQKREKWSNGNAFAMRESAAQQAWLSNFRLQRCTSAYLAAYSGWNAAASQGSPKGTTQRLGLAYTMPFKNEEGVLEGMASYIVGAWCVGTVLDSAASRAQVGQLVRTNPTSMALSVYVNIEWWSGDKLHRHYMDKGNDEATLARGEKRKRETSNNGDETPYELPAMRTAMPRVPTDENRSTFYSVKGQALYGLIRQDAKEFALRKVREFASGYGQADLNGSPRLKEQLSQVMEAATRAFNIGMEYFYVDAKLKESVAARGVAKAEGSDWGPLQEDMVQKQKKVLQSVILQYEAARKMFDTAFNQDSMSVLLRSIDDEMKDAWTFAGEKIEDGLLDKIRLLQQGKEREIGDIRRMLDDQPEMSQEGQKALLLQLYNASYTYQAAENARTDTEQYMPKAAAFEQALADSLATGADESARELAISTQNEMEEKARVVSAAKAVLVSSLNEEDRQVFKVASAAFSNEESNGA